MCIMVNVTEWSPNEENTAISLALLIPDPLTNYIDALGLPHRRAPMATRNDVQHWYRVLTVRHPLITIALSFVARVRAFIRPSVYSILYPLVTRVGIPIVSVLADLMTYSLFLLPHCSIVRPNSMKPSDGSNQLRCCADSFPTVWLRLRRYVMDPYFFRTPDIICISKWHRITLALRVAP